MASHATDRISSWLTQHNRMPENRPRSFRPNEMMRGLFLGGFMDAQNWKVIHSLGISLLLSCACDLLTKEEKSRGSSLGYAHPISLRAIQLKKKRRGEVEGGNPKVEPVVDVNSFEQLFWFLEAVNEAADRERGQISLSSKKTDGNNEQDEGGKSLIVETSSRTTHSATQPVPPFDVLQVILHVKDDENEQLLPLFPYCARLIHYFLQRSAKNSKTQSWSNVLVHCMAGRSRSPSILGAYFVQQYYQSAAGVSDLDLLHQSGLLSSSTTSSLPQQKETNGTAAATVIMMKGGQKIESSTEQQKVVEEEKVEKSDDEEVKSKPPMHPAASQKERGENTKSQSLHSKTGSERNIPKQTPPSPVPLLTDSFLSYMREKRLAVCPNDAFYQQLLQWETQMIADIE